MRRTNKLRATGVLALAVMGTGVSGCIEGAKEFREAAGPSLEAGINAILDGLVDGLFAVIEPDTATNSSTGG